MTKIICVNDIGIDGDLEFFVVPDELYEELYNLNVGFPIIMGEDIANTDFLERIYNCKQITQPKADIEIKVY